MPIYMDAQTHRFFWHWHCPCPWSLILDPWSLILDPWSLIFDLWCWRWSSSLSLIRDDGLEDSPPSLYFRSWAASILNCPGRADDDDGDGGDDDHADDDGDDSDDHADVDDSNWILNPVVLGEQMQSVSSSLSPWIPILFLKKKFILFGVLRNSFCTFPNNNQHHYHDGGSGEIQKVFASK